MKKIGTTIIRDGVYPEKHELETAWFLNSQGKDVEFLAPIRTKGIRTPDIAMDGSFWEIKCPVGHGKYTIQRLFKHAVRQSANVIFDLRKIKIPDDVCLKRLNSVVSSSKSIKRLLVITKSLEVLDIKK
jgi:hypothetical protein